MLYTFPQHMVYVVFKCVFRRRGGTAITFLVEARAMHRPPMRFLASGQLGTDKHAESILLRSLFPQKTVSVIGKCLFCFSDDDTANTHNFASHPFASFLAFMLSQPKKHVFYVFVVLQLFLWGPNMLHSSIQYTTQVIARAEYQSERERRRGRGDNLSSLPPPPPSVPRKKETLCRE